MIFSAFPVWQVLLAFALVRAFVAIVAVIMAPPERRPWGAPVQGVAEICCALLLRLYLDPPYRAAIGGWAWLVFACAVVWSFTIWIRQLWALASDEDVPPQPSVLDSFGIAVETGLMQVAGIMWHIMFVAPALVCGAFVLFGLVDELPHH